MTRSKQEILEAYELSNENSREVGRVNIELMCDIRDCAAKIQENLNGVNYNLSVIPGISSELYEVKRELNKISDAALSIGTIMNKPALVEQKKIHWWQRKWHWNISFKTE